ncbi:MAG: hypothetical protein GY941_19900 [Planctomycetes bacterium]|nr:hypothetical protein [Planctomycetota bacterium]
MAEQKAAPTTTTEEKENKIFLGLNPQSVDELMGLIDTALKASGISGMQVAGKFINMINGEIVKKQDSAK